MENSREISGKLVEIAPRNWEHAYIKFVHSSAFFVVALFVSTSMDFFSRSGQSLCVSSEKLYRRKFSRREICKMNISFTCAELVSGSANPSQGAIFRQPDCWDSSHSPSIVRPSTTFFRGWKIFRVFSSLPSSETTGDLDVARQQRTSKNAFFTHSPVFSLIIDTKHSRSCN